MAAEAAPFPEPVSRHLVQHQTSSGQGQAYVGPL